MQIAEMYMLPFMSGVSRQDRIRNDYIRRTLGMVDIRQKMRKHRVRWFGHMMRRGEGDLVEAFPGLRVKGRRSRSGPKVT